MAINFANINLEVIDITTNATPDLFINQNAVTFSKRVLEDLGYPANVQYSSPKMRMPPTSAFPAKRTARFA